MQDSRVMMPGDGGGKETAASGTASVARHHTIDNPEMLERVTSHAWRVAQRMTVLRQKFSCSSLVPLGKAAAELICYDRKTV